MNTCEVPNYGLDPQLRGDPSPAMGRKWVDDNDGYSFNFVWLQVHNTDFSLDKLILIPDKHTELSDLKQ